MPVYEIEANGKTYEVDAPSRQAAFEAFSGNAPSTGEDMARLGLTGATLGVSDKILGAQAAGGPATMGTLAANIQQFIADNGRRPTPYEIQALGRGAVEERISAMDEATRAEMDKTAAARERQGWAGTAAEIGGALATAPFAPVMAPFRGAGALRAAGNAAATSVLPGAVAGYGYSQPGEGIEGALTGAGVGALAGGAIGGGIQRARNALAQRGANRAIASTAPTADDLTAEAGRLYGAAEGSPAVVSPARFQEFADDVATQMQREAIDPDLTPSATAALNRIQGLADEGVPVSFQDLNTMSKRIGMVAGQPNPADRRLGGKMADALNDLVEGLGTDDLLVGTGVDAQQAAGNLRNARLLWSRQAKDRTIAEAVEKASNASTDFRTAMRGQVRSILNNPKRARRFSETEREAMQAFVRGGTVENLMDRLGTLSPARGGMIGLGGVGAAIYEPTTMLATGAAELARRGANRGARVNTELLSAMMRSGQAPGRVTVPPIRAANRSAIPLLPMLLGE